VAFYPPGFPTKTFYASFILPHVQHATY
jgi:hypothetical protein